MSYWSRADAKVFLILLAAIVLFLIVAIAVQTAMTGPEFSLLSDGIAIAGHLTGGGGAH